MFLMLIAGNDYEPVRESERNYSKCMVLRCALIIKLIIIKKMDYTV